MIDILLSSAILVSAAQSKEAWSKPPWIADATLELLIDYNSCLENSLDAAPSESAVVDAVDSAFEVCSSQRDLALDHLVADFSRGPGPISEARRNAFRTKIANEMRIRARAHLVSYLGKKREK